MVLTESTTASGARDGRRALHWAAGWGRRGLGGGLPGGTPSAASLRPRGSRKSAIRELGPPKNHTEYGIWALIPYWHWNWALWVAGICMDCKYRGPSIIMVLSRLPLTIILTSYSCHCACQVPPANRFAQLGGGALLLAYEEHCGAEASINTNIMVPYS